jgi:FkbM family methyltransferase
MRLTPGRRRGVAGLIFVFREEVEPVTREAIKRYVHSGDTVFDIGANIGLWSLYLAELVGDRGTVEAFEPVPGNIQRLEENLELSGHRNVHVHTIALGSKTGAVYLYVPYDPGSAALAPEQQGDHLKVTAQCRRLDDVWAERGRPHVAFVKMDVEGSEPEVLRGAREFLATCNPVITCEINQQKLKALGESSGSIFEFLGYFGYKFYNYNDANQEFEELDPRADEGGWYDILCLP